MKNNNYDIPGIEKFYKMDKGNMDKFAECAALAYDDYPLFKYVMNGNTNFEMLKAILYPSFASVKDQVIGYANNESADAMAIFAPPHYKGSKLVPFMSNGGIKLMYLAPLSTFSRLMTYEHHAMKLKKQFTGHECWYLYNVTVKPQFQNRGYCSQILRPMLEYFDQTGQDCYLETHSENDVGLYEHYNFELLDVSYIPKTKVKHYAMLRKSQNKDE